MTWCATYEGAAAVERRHAWQHDHGEATPALNAYHTEHAWRGHGEAAIRDEMERRLAIRWPPALVVGAIVPLPRHRYTEADLLAAYLTTPLPRTRESLARTLGLHQGTLQKRLSHHHLTLHRLAILADAAVPA